MKLTCFLLIISFLQVHATGLAQNVTISVKNASIENVFREIERQTSIGFLYSKKILQGAGKVSLNVKDVPVEEVLKECFKGQSFHFSIQNNTIVIKKSVVTSPVIRSDESVEQLPLGIDVRGKVTDENGSPLAGVSILIKGTSKGTATNEKGEYNLSDVDENATLVFSIIGFTSQTVSMKKSSTINITLQRDLRKQEEVVISTGYQTISKERATGAFEVISGKQIENKIQTNVLERLEGLVPGLLMINGKDEGGDAVTIRGVSTLYGTKSPLIVVDNFPIEGGINSVNPNDVETITVLKDAAAASIWGARAANGVIVITTKKGKSGKTDFQYTNSFQFTEKPDLGYLNRLSSSDDIDISRKLLTAGPNLENNAKRWGDLYSTFSGLLMDSIAGRLSPSEYSAKVDQLRGLDNTQQIKDLLMQNPFVQNHTLSFSGGGEKSTFYSSLNFTDRNSYTLKSDSRSYSVFLKSSHEISKRLTLGINTNFTFGEGSSSPVSPLSMFNLKPYEMLQDSDGNPLGVKRQSGSLGLSESNPFIIDQRMAWGLDDETYYPLLELDRKDITNSSAAQRLFSELNYKIANGITANVSYQLEKGSSFGKTYTHRNQADHVKLINDNVAPFKVNYVILTNTDGTLRSPKFHIPRGGRVDERRSDNTAYSLRASLRVNKMFNDHAIAGIAGVERSATRRGGNSISKFGYDDNTLNFIQIDHMAIRTVPGILQMENGGIRRGIPVNDNFFYSEDRFISAFANGSYTYKNKYIYSGSFRIDQTNLFGTDPKYRYRPLWSTGLSWIISREDFMRNNPFINHLQLRTTYGLNGNVPKNSGPFMIAQAGIHWWTSNPSYSITGPENASLRWEKTAVTNLGIDFTLLNNRVSGKLDYYVRRSTDLLADEKLNPTYGFTTSLLNTASMNNDGLEIQLTTRNIQKPNFSWSSTFAYSKNKNKITKVALATYYANAREVASGRPYFVGKPYGALYSVRFGGLSNEDGQLQILDQNGKIEPPGQLNGSLDAAFYSGNRRPESNGAVSNSLRYKDLELNFMFVFYLGHVMRENTPRASNGVAHQDGRLADAWKKPGDEEFTNIPNVIVNSNGSYAMAYYRNILDINVFEADYAKLREVILTYNIAPEIFNGRYIKGLQLNAQARNLWTLTKNNLGIDPESFDGGQRTMRVMPTYAFGINLKF
ncbi:MAG: SusC/RagA family TonB-linked outer membrane protein [Ginsengibacter sp.]